MISDLLRWFSLTKATTKSIESILKNNNFIYKKEDVSRFLLGNEKGTRYGNAVLIRNENSTQIKRFLKIMLDGKLKTFRAFQRQIKVAGALSSDTSYKHPVIKIIKYSFNSGVPYAIFETREEGNGFGFMHDSLEFYTACFKEDMRSITDAIYAFHLAGRDIDTNIWKYTVKIPSSFEYQFGYVNQDLNQLIVHKTNRGVTEIGKVKEVIGRYLNRNDIEEKITQLFRNQWKIVIESEKPSAHYLVHADMQIDNLYKHRDGTFELLDFEWVGKSNSPLIAIMYDYGNLRARAWSSPVFQMMLDEAMLEIGLQYYDKKIVEAGILLGKIKFCVMINRFHLDYVNTVKKRQEK